MNIAARLGSDLLIARVEESRIDAASAIRFKDRMRELVADAPPRVVLDLTQVSFLDSSGLGALVAVLKMLAPPRRLELAGLGPAVEKVLRLTRMDSVFTVLATVPDLSAEAL